jgi:hypothetical protein
MYKLKGSLKYLYIFLILGKLLVSLQKKDILRGKTVSAHRALQV